MYANNFGSFRAALEHYGLEHSGRRSSRETWTLDDLIDHFAGVWELNEAENRGRLRPLLPSEGVLTRYNRLKGFSGPCAETYRRLWGSFPGFARAFGMFSRGETSRQALRDMAAGGKMPVPSNKVPGHGEGIGRLWDGNSSGGNESSCSGSEPAEAPGKSPNRSVRRERIPNWMRDLVLKRANGHCEMPGCERELGLHPRIDHKIPVSAGGPTDIDNLRATCDPCNRAKSDSLVEPITVFFHVLGYKKLPNGIVEEIAKKWRGEPAAGEMLHDMTVIARYAKQTKARAAG